MYESIPPQLILCMFQSIIETVNISILIKKYISILEMIN